LLSAGQLDLSAELACRQVCGTLASTPDAIRLPLDMPGTSDACPLRKDADRRLKPDVIAFAQLHSQLVESAGPRITVTQLRREVTCHGTIMPGSR
jgi:hypothetical protein